MWKGKRKKGRKKTGTKKMVGPAQTPSKEGERCRRRRGKDISIMSS